MRFRSLRICALVATLFVAPFIALASALGNEVANFSFELPIVPANPGFLTLNAGDTALTGWTIGKSSVDLIGPIYDPITGPAFHGLNFLDLDGTPGPGAVSQSIPTNPGTFYALFFAYSNNAEVGGNPGVTVSLSNTDLVPVTVSHSTAVDGSLDWDTQTLFFQALSTSSTLLFESTSPEGHMGGILLDAVSINEAPGRGVPTQFSIPEPASLSFAGLGALALLRRRK